jgi:phage RecT family recombinase
MEVSVASELVALEQQLKPLAPHFAQVLGKTMPVERLMRTIMISVERLPMLLQCDRQSIFNAAMSAACLGLEVDGVTGQAYLIPFKGKAQLVIGYKGFNTLAARSGITITGAVVREGDEFDYQLGTAAYVRHKPKGSKGKITHAWACAQSLDRPAVVEVLDMDELLAVKGRSPGAKRSDSPWNDPAIGFPAMCQKTAKRRLARAMPLNIMQQAARMDEAVDEQGAPAWISPEKGVVIDGEFNDAPTIYHEQRGVDELLAPRQAAPVMPAAGAADIPTAADYHEQWRVMMFNATRSDQLATTWNGQKALHKQIAWTDEHSYEDLKSRVLQTIERMKAPA